MFDPKPQPDRRYNRMTHFIDLSHESQECATGNAPPPSHEGKFVQIRNDTDEYLVFAPKGLCKYHSHIVETFASLQNIDIRENDKGDTVYFVDSMWEIVGGGKMKIDRNNRSIELGGLSQAYGPFDTAGLKSRLTPSFEGYTINVA